MGIDLGRVTLPQGLVPGSVIIPTHVAAARRRGDVKAGVVASTFLEYVVEEDSNYTDTEFFIYLDKAGLKMTPHTSNKGLKKTDGDDGLSSTVVEEPDVREDGGEEQDDLRKGDTGEARDRANLVDDAMMERPDVSEQGFGERKEMGDDEGAAGDEAKRDAERAAEAEAAEAAGESVEQADDSAKPEEMGEEEENFEAEIYETPDMNRNRGGPRPQQSTNQVNSTYASVHRINNPVHSSGRYICPRRWQTPSNIGQQVAIPENQSILSEINTVPRINTPTQGRDPDGRPDPQPRQEDPRRRF
eukprot:Selendium_serpulae@DN6160_c0_g1_i10.p1